MRAFHMQKVKTVNTVKDWHGLVQPVCWSSVMDCIKKEPLFNNPRGILVCFDKAGLTKLGGQWVLEDSNSTEWGDGNPVSSSAAESAYRGEPGSLGGGYRVGIWRRPSAFPFPLRQLNSRRKLDHYSLSEHHSWQTLKLVVRIAGARLFSKRLLEIPVQTSHREMVAHVGSTIAITCSFCPREEMLVHLFLESSDVHYSESLGGEIGWKTDKVLVHFWDKMLSCSERKDMFT